MLVIIIVVIFALLLVGVYLIGKSGKLNSKGSPEEDKTYDEKKYSMGANAYLPVSTWGQFKPNEKTNVYSGSCLNYTAVSSGLVLGFPSIDDLNTNTNNYIKSTQECVDPDQILAQAGTHTCVNPNNGGGGTGCITSTTFTSSVTGTTYVTGDFVPVGVTEGLTPVNPYYITCGSKVCPGEIGLIVPNFTNIVDPTATLAITNKNGPNYPICLQNNGSSNPATGSFNTSSLPCDLSDIGQVFRMIRYSFDDNYVSSVNSSGIYAAIIHRATGFYLAPEMNYAPSINPVTGDPLGSGFTYYFDSLNVSTDPNDSTNTYVNLIMIDPKYDTVRNGIYWLLQNQTPDASKPSDAVDPANSKDCNASYVYPIVPGKETPKNCLSTGVPPWYNPCNPDSNSSPVDSLVYTCQNNTDTYFPVSPQQFVYIPNIYLVPKDTTDLIEYWTYLTNQYSIQLSNTSVLDTTNWRSVDDAYKGVYSPSAIYGIGDIVYYNIGTKGFYMSIFSPNLSNTPSSLGIYWVYVGFTASPSGPSQVLPLTVNYKNSWNARTLYYGPASDISVNPTLTGDVVNSSNTGNVYTFIQIATPNPSPPPTETGQTPTLNPPAASALPTPVNLTQPPTSPASNSYWQQIYTYSNSIVTTYIQGQLFATSEGACYIYTGSNGTSTFLPNIFTSVSNTPMLKKFMTNIPADVFYYDNPNHDSGKSPIRSPNPFYGVSAPPFDIPQPFGTGQYMQSIQSLNDLLAYYKTNNTTNFVVASITPKLTTTPSPPAGSFTDTTTLYDSQFISAVNLKLQLQAPVSVLKDPISYNYTNYNPFNVTQ